MTALALIILLLAGWAEVAVGQPDAGSIYRIRVEGPIDLGISAYMARVLDEADRNGARAAVLHINTPGGRLDAALDIKDAILNARTPTLAFIDRQAYSAGALIAIAAEEIYMAPGAVIGAATPVTGETGETASEKVISAVRSAFAATAEARGRNAAVAAAMVDESVAVEGLVEAGRLLTLTADEAALWGYADGAAADFPDLLEQKGWEDLPLVDSSPGLAEQVVRFLTNPVVASLLITLGFLGMLFELQSAGFGLAGLVGLSSLALFFFGHMVAGLAGLEGVLLVLLGLALIAVEIFVIPGFGLAGAAGVLALVGGLFVSMVGDFTFETQVYRAIYVIAASLLLIILGTWLSLKYLPRTRRLTGLVLVDSLAGAVEPAPGVNARDVSAREPRALSLEGATGVAVTDLRPAGRAEIQGRPVDVVTEGQWLEAGTAIEVIQDEGYRRVVRPIRA